MRRDRRICESGVTWQFQFSLFWLNTNHSLEAVFGPSGRSWTNDRLAVIDASGGVVTTWDAPPPTR